MPVQLIILCFLLVTNSLAFARGPAVEDFVGIEIEETPSSMHGAELLYNLEQDVSLISQAGTTPEQTSQGIERRPWSTSAFFSLIALLGLPLLIWSLAMNYFRKKAQTESAANLEILENYRKQKAESQEEEHKKAS